MPVALLFRYVILAPVSIPEFIHKIPVYIKWLGGLGITTTMLLGFFEGLRKRVLAVILWAWHAVRPKKAARRVELKISPERTGFCQWQEGSRGANPIMMVYCRMAVANVGTQPTFQIVNAYIKKPRTHGQITAPPMPLGMPSEADRLAIPVEARFTVEPPCVESKQIFKADIVLVDQFAVEHVAKNVEFTPIGGPGWDALKKRNAEIKEKERLNISKS